MCSRRSHWSPPAVPSLLGVADRLAAFRSAVCSPSGGAAGRSLERRGGRCFTPVSGYSLHHKQPGQEGEAKDQPTCVMWSSFWISLSLFECLFLSDVQMRELALTFCHQLQSKFLDTASGEQVLHLSQKHISVYFKIKHKRCLTDIFAPPAGDQEPAVHRQGDLPHFPRVRRHLPSGGS